jgi:restriction endonuclease
MKKYLPYILPVLILGGVLTAGTLVLAQTTGTTYPSIIQKLADKFNLNPADVQSVFNQSREEIQANAQQNFQNVLDQMVTDQKITQDQENAIIAERTKIQNELQALKDQSTDYSFQSYQNRQTQMQAIRDEVSQWAQDNNLNPGFIMGGEGGFGRHMGFGGMGMMMRGWHNE